MAPPHCWQASGPSQRSRGRLLGLGLLLLATATRGQIAAARGLSSEGDVYLCGAQTDGIRTLRAAVPYFLACQFYVRSGSTLVIEPGTVITAVAHDASHTSMPAIVIERGGRIIANGTQQLPITFTAADGDEVSEGTSITDTSGDGVRNPVRGRRGKWGGLLILGRAPVQHASGSDPEVEGLAGYPYGGTDPLDSSGVLRYVRIWHSGAIIAANNEINGLTLAGERATPHACVFIFILHAARHWRMPRARCARAWHALFFRALILIVGPRARAPHPPKRASACPLAHLSHSRPPRATSPLSDA